MDKGIVIIAVFSALILLFLVLFEKSRFSTKETSIIIVLAALAALSRIPFAAIPSAQPTTFIVIMSGFVFGGLPGFLTGAVAAFVSNMFMGQGPWTIFQMLAWGLCGLSAGMLGRITPDTKRIYLIIFGFFWGYLFGWINNIWHWYSFISPLTLKSWIFVNATSFWFDTIHAVTNTAFIGFFGADMMKILKRFKKKLSYSKAQ